jgi:hypothetical protein
MDPRILKGNRANPHSVVALMSCPPVRSDIPKLFEFTNRLLTNLGHPPNFVAIHRGERHGRYVRATARMLRAVEHAHVTGFSLVYVPPPETEPTRSGWLQGGTTGKGFTISGRSDILSPDTKVIITLVRELAGLLSVVYGFQYVIDASFGPAFHSMGMLMRTADFHGAVTLPESERTRTSDWFNRWRHLVPLGHLRDVFPLNFLTEIHRKRTMNGVPLFKWIGADPARGSLQQIRPGLWAWQVPEERCAQLGDEFEAAGMLTSGEMNAAPLPADLPSTAEGIATYARAKLGTAIRAIRDRPDGGRPRRR